MKGLKSATMLYRKGTQERLHGVHVDTVVVDEHQVEEALDDGWHRSPADVKKAEDAERAAFEERERRRDEEHAEQLRRDREEADQRAEDQRAAAAHAAAERIATERAAAEKAKPAPTPAAEKKQPAATKSE